jgi:hypothetical protein
MRSAAKKESIVSSIVPHAPAYTFKLDTMTDEGRGVDHHIADTLAAICCFGRLHTSDENTTEQSLQSSKAK